MSPIKNHYIPEGLSIRKGTPITLSIGILILLVGGVMWVTMVYATLTNSQTQLQLGQTVTSKRLDVIVAHQASTDQTLGDLRVFMARMDGNMDVLLRANGVQPADIPAVVAPQSHK